MNLPGTTLRRRAHFDRQLIARQERLLTFAFAGPWTRSAANGFVLRAPLGTLHARARLSLAGVTSDLKREKVQKWGESFTPDGDMEFSCSVLEGVYAGQQIASVSDPSDPGGPVIYDVLFVPPAAYGEDVYRTAWVRLQPVYNRLVQVTLQGAVDGGSQVLLANLPCRLTPDGSALDFQEAGLGGVATAGLRLECPYVLSGTDAPGPGVVAVPPGALVRMPPKQAIVTDDPAAYGMPGLPVRYRVDGPSQDAGGDGHHSVTMVSLA